MPLTRCNALPTLSARELRRGYGSCLVLAQMLRAAGMQGAYFVVTGLWPVLHLSSFEKVTGGKVDGWLVKTFGGFIAATGMALLIADADRLSSERAIRVLGIGSATALAISDFIYVKAGRISPVYLLDLVGEAVIVAAWLARPTGKAGTEHSQRSKYPSSATRRRSGQS
jgi:hypothetical protein